MNLKTAQRPQKYSRILNFDKRQPCANKTYQIKGDSLTDTGRSA